MMMLHACCIFFVSRTDALTPAQAFTHLANASREYRTRDQWLHGARLHQHKPFAPTVTVFDDHDTRAHPFTNVSCFRIPSLVTFNVSTLLAFAEARIGSCADCQRVGIVSKRSTDGGVTWGEMQYVVPPDASGANPTTFVDRETNDVWLHYARGTRAPHECSPARTNWQRRSTDGGRTWDEPPTNITAALGTYAGALPGPGNAVAYRDSYRVPMHYGTAERSYGRDLVLASDDRGRTWTVHTSDTLQRMDEASLVQVNATTTKRWAMYMRNGHRNASCKCKARAMSTDGGRTWDGTPLVYEPQLVDPVCQGSVTRIDNELFYVTPTFAYARTALTVFRTSAHDVDAYSPSKWAAHAVTDETVFSGYSAVTDQWLGNRTIGVLWTACDVPLPFRVWCGVGWAVRFSRVQC